MGSTSGPTRRRGWSRPPRVAAARRLAGGRALGVGRGSEVHNTYVSLTCRLRVRRARPPHVLQLYTVYAPLLFRCSRCLSPPRQDGAVESRIYNNK